MRLVTTLPEKKDYSQTKRESLLIGADPEVFLFTRHKNGRRKFVAPPWGVDGTLSKEKRLKVEGAGYIHVDGLAMEYNVDPTPVTEPQEFVRKVRKLKRTIEEMACDYGLEPAWDQNWAIFNKDYYKELDPELKRLGCNPDVTLAFSYDGIVIKRKGPDYVESRVRYTGGHVHYGWTSGEDVEDPFHIVKCAILLEELSRKQLRYAYNSRRGRSHPRERRHSPYNTHCICRIKDYGVEWRAPCSLVFNDDRHLEENVRILCFAD